MALRDQLAEIWSEILQIEPTDDADFFVAGGNSLLGAQMSAAAGEVVGQRVPLRLLFDHPRFAAYVDAVDAHLAAPTK